MMIISNEMWFLFWWNRFQKQNYKTRKTKPKLDEKKKINNKITRVTRLFNQQNQWKKKKSVWVFKSRAQQQLVLCSHWHFLFVCYLYVYYEFNQMLASYYWHCAQQFPFRCVLVLVSSSFILNYVFLYLYTISVWPNICMMCMTLYRKEHTRYISVVGTVCIPCI